MSDPVEPTAAHRALERLVSALVQRIDDLEQLVARNTDDAAAALAAASGHDVRISSLEDSARLDDAVVSIRGHELGGRISGMHIQMGG